MAAHFAEPLLRTAGGELRTCRFSLSVNNLCHVGTPEAGSSRFTPTEYPYCSAPACRRGRRSPGRHLDRDGRDAPAKSNRSRACGREVDDAAAYKRAAIVDGDYDRLSGPLIGHTHLGAKWQRTVRCSQSARIETLAACSLASTFCGVDRRDTRLGPWGLCL